MEELLEYYHTHDFRNILSEIISPAQRALFNIILIDGCLDDILNAYHQERDQGNHPLILQDFQLSQNCIGQISTYIRSGLGGKNSIPNSMLHSRISPLNFKTPIIHPLLFNIACLVAKRPPCIQLQQILNLSPNTVEWKRRWAINAYYRIMGINKNYDTNCDSYFTDRESHNEWRTKIKKPTNWIYSQLIARYPAQPN